ncbi:hypothetical protein ACQ4M4_27110 [Leptolyngbya sp. AN02str]|uniref:hypothetical protein n=1 Tax=Leptolyngbya sp. AN02str TaxID=3423363 RepID=UPI003D3109BE
MRRSEAIKLLEHDNWTKADAARALEQINFDDDPDELAILRAASLFAGSELYKRQRLQAAQKGMVTKKTKEIEVKTQETTELSSKVQVLATEKDELSEANDQLKKDNKALKNLIDAIRLQISLDVKRLLNYEDSEIRRALMKWFKSTQG